MFVDRYDRMKKFDVDVSYIKFVTIDLSMGEVFSRKLFQLL